LQLIRIVHLSKGVHAKLAAGLEAGFPGRVIQHREHQQDRRRTVAPRLRDLVGAEDEILAQHGDIFHPRVHAREVGNIPAEKFRFGQHRNGVSHAFIGGREVRRIVVPDQHPGRRRCRLAFQYEPGVGLA